MESYIRSNSYISQKSIRHDGGPEPIPSVLMYVAALSCLIGGVSMGCVVAWSSVALPDLARPESDPQITLPNERSLISSLGQLGGCLGCLLGGPLADRFGRKTLICGCIAPWLMGHAMIFVAPTATILMIGRFFTGIGAGLVCSGIPMYLCEISTPAIRGLLGSSFETFITVGMFYVTAVGVSFDVKWLSAFCIVPLAFLAATMPFMPESPIWLSGRGRKADARAALQRLRGCKSDLTWELMAMDDSFIQSTDSINSGSEKSQEPQNVVSAWVSKQWTLWRRPDAWKPLLFGIVLAFFQQLCGLTGLLYNQKDILLSANMDIDENLATVGIFAAQMVCTTVAGFLIDRLGRRPLLIFSGAVQGGSLVVLGLYFRYSAWFASNGISWIPVVLLVVFFVGYSFGQGPVTWCAVGELSPNFIRGQVASITAASNWFMCFIAAQTFDSLLEALAISGTFWLEAATCVVSIWFAWFILPETKGKTLEEIQLIYTNGKKI